MAAHSDKIGRNISRAFDALADELAPPTTDSDRVRAFPQDPVGFAIEILGIDPWSKQIEILEKVLKHKRVAVVSGHKCGKSTALAILALWFYCSFPGARVVITATTDRQVNGIIWREVKRLVRLARVAIPYGAKIKVKAAAGLTDESDFSEIRGYTAREAEAIAGTSGAYILYLVDEASGVAPAIFQAIEGNRAGGSAWVFLISNPTKADGEFYDAFHSKSVEVMPRAGYANVHISSEMSPNVTGEYRKLREWDPVARAWRLRTALIPGMAEPEWIAEKIEEWGRDSPLFKIRVAGLFCAAEERKVFNSDLLTAAEREWDPDGCGEGRLFIGVDPAGDGDGGDQSGFAWRRGMRVHGLRAQAGLSAAAHVREVLDIIATEGAQHDKWIPCVNVESEGAAGWEVFKALREHAEKHPGSFIVHRVQTSWRAIRQPQLYFGLRDELWANGREWLRDGGTFPSNAQLTKDLHTPEFSTDARGLSKVTPKKELRKLLGRSPDIGDAFLVAVWTPASTREEDEPPQQGPAPEIEDLRDAGLSPYAASDCWRGGRGGLRGAANDTGPQEPVPRVA